MASGELCPHKGGRLFPIREGLKLKGKSLSVHVLLYYVDTALLLFRGRGNMVVFTKHHSYWCLGLVLPSLQNSEK